MSKLLELVAATVADGDLADDPDHESASDRVGAMAGLDPLGSALLRYRDSGDRRSRGPLLSLLVKKVRKRGEPRGIVYRLVRHAVDEHMRPTCSRCNGKGAVESYTKRVTVCKACNGSGMAAQNVMARMRALGVSIVVYEKKYAELFARVHNVLGTTEGNNERRLARQLERGACRRD